MLFNSTDFLLFYVVVFCSYRLLGLVGVWRLRKLLLLAASYVFYMSWNPPFVLLLLLSTAVDFVAGKKIHATHSQATRRGWLVVSLTANLGILAYFKYGRFLFQNVTGMFMSTASAPAFLDVVLPLGISFYTFQTMSYSIDVYRGTLRPADSLLDFALYVGFFPQLVAGPIVRATHFLPQLRKAPTVTEEGAEEALMLIALGLFKKVVCADVLGEYVDGVFGNVEAYHGLNLLVAVYAYAFQIYFDFSGYSDMAIGLAGLLGFRLPINFRLPYLAENPSEFWRRWHISLSTWLRDYLYISLGGNRLGEILTYRNLMITMLLGGLWHGAAWNFVFWGFYHGLLLGVHRRFFRGRKGNNSHLAIVIRRVGMFHLACIGWVFFRAQSGSDAWVFFRNLFAPGLELSAPFWRAMAWSAAAFLVHQLCDGRSPGRSFLRWPPEVKAVVYGVVCLLVFLFSPGTARFIYFQF